MNFSQLINSINKGTIAPFYLLVVQENYLAREALNCFIQALVPPMDRGFNLEIVEAAEAGIGGLKDAMGTLPLLGQRRLVIIKNFHNFKDRGTASTLSRYLDNPDPSTVIVFTAAASDKRTRDKTLAAALDQRKAFNKSLLQRAQVVELKKLDARQAVTWLSKRAESGGKTMEKDAARYLVTHAGTNLWTLQNELEKAIAYTGDREKITRQDLLALVGDIHTDSIFDLTDAVGERDLDKALGIMKNILAHGATHLSVLGMLARQFRLIWQAQSLAQSGIPSSGMPRSLGVHPFVMKKLVSQSRKFTERELASCFKKMSALDRRWKRMDTRPGLLLENLLLDFCRGS